MKHDEKKRTNYCLKQSELDVFGFFESSVPGPVFWKVRIYSDLGFFKLTFGSFLENCPHSSSFQNMNTGFTVTNLFSLIHL